MSRQDLKNTRGNCRKDSLGILSSPADSTWIETVEGYSIDVLNPHIGKDRYLVVRLSQLAMASM